MELQGALTEAKATSGARRPRKPARLGRRSRRRIHAAHPSRDGRARARPVAAGAVRIERLGRSGRPLASRLLGRRRTPNRDAVWLRQELDASKQYLQSMLDAQDAVNQELRAAHEEVLSSNEELQSTNEELETTKEELQSANEELTTVNEQFQSRNRELDALADDLSNFISSADVPMVTVGRDLTVRRLTAGAQPRVQPAAHRRRAFD